MDNNKNRQYSQIDKLTIFGNKYRIQWTKKSKPRLRESCSLILISASRELCTWLITWDYDDDDDDDDDDALYLDDDPDYALAGHHNDGGGTLLSGHPHPVPGSSHHYLQICTCLFVDRRLDTLQNNCIFQE